MTQFALAGRTQIRAALLVAAACAIILATVWGFQLIAGYVPCALCLEQRIAYYAALPIALIAALAAHRMQHGMIARGLLALAGLLILWSVAIAVYQAGAEWGFWPGPSDCGGGATTPSSAADLINAMRVTRIVRCDVASLRVLGLSFAGWNAVAGTIVAAIALAGAAASAKRESGLPRL
jgi:disulfide bond formation protein DsbB